MSLAIAYTIGAILALAGVVLSLLYTGSALVTTAIGTLLPILSDAGELRTRLGTYLLAAGSVGEIGPVLLLTLFLSAQGTLHDALILLAFLSVAVAAAVAALRASQLTLPVLQRTLEHSTQLAVRWTIVLIFALAWLAYRLGLDLLLGGFAAGMITRQMLRDYELAVFESKLMAVAFGVFVPFFFIVSGMKLDVTALFASPGGAAKIFLFFALFLVVRGTPRCCCTEASSIKANGARSRSSAPRNSRSWSRSRPWRPPAATCGPRPPPPWSAPRSSQRSSSRSSG
jgi:Kef-type K+ transport system membrane component KefB